MNSNPNNRRRRNRLLWLILIGVSIAIFAFFVGAILILRSLGIYQGNAILTTISIIIGVVIGLLSLLIGFLQWYSPRHTGEHHAPTISSQETSLTEQVLPSSVSSQQSSGSIPTVPLDIPASPAFGPTLILKHEQVANLAREDWGKEAPHVENLYGREKELSKLKGWIINDHCRLVVVLGISGIGKTALTAKLAEQIKDNFDYIFWRSLQNAPLLEGTLKDCIQFFSSQQEIDLPESLDDKITVLLQYLRDHRCLLILDNIETVLSAGNYAGQYRQEYEGYRKLIRRLGEAKHQSCLLLVSWEKPQEIVDLEGADVRPYLLKGIGYLEAQEILKDKQLLGTDEAWKALVKLYSGNPLALKLAAAYIRYVCRRDIATFLKEGESVFGGIRNLLDQHFQRLSELEQELMYWLAIEREAVSLDILQNDLVRPVSRRELLEAISSLHQRCMIEITDTRLFTLQPVIMGYFTNRLIEQISEEIETEKIRLFASHALMKAQGKDYVRDIQARLILTPIVEQLLSILGKEGIEKKLKNILSTLHKMAPNLQGYTAGNALNLLIRLESDLRSYDFSRLIVRQAYLSDVNLSGINFAHADLATSVFSDTFGSTLSTVFSPDGELLATGTTRGEIRVWQATSGTPLYTYYGHTDWVRSVAFSPDGRLLASGSEDQSVRLWEVNTGRCLQTLQGHSGRVYSVAFSSDGRLLASGNEDRTIELWDVSTGKCLQTLQGHSGRVYSVALSPDGRLLASGSEDQSVRLWEVSTGQLVKTRQGHTHRIRSVAFSPDGRLLASGSEDQSVRLWDVSTGQLLKTLQAHTTARVRSVAFSSDGRLLASGSEDQSIRLWDVSTGQLLKTLPGHTNWVRSVTFSPDGRLLASGSEDQSVRLWDVSTGQLLKTLQGHTNWIWSVAFSPDGRLLASGNEDRTIQLWDVSASQPLRILTDTNRVRSVAFSPDGHLLVSGGDGQSIYLWDVSTGQHLKALQGHTHRIWSVAFSPDGRLVASGADSQSIYLWDVSTGQRLKALQGHRHQIRSVTFSPDGHLLASGSDDQTVRLWEVDTGKLLKILQGHTNRIYSIAFSPDGRLLASGSDDQTVRLWEVDTGHCLKTLQGHTERVRSGAFSPDGRLLASGSDDQTVRLWEVDTGHCLKILQGHTHQIRSVVFRPDGRTIASGSADGTINLWDVQKGVCWKTLKTASPYQGMNIMNVKGLTEPQKNTLKALGAVDEFSQAYKRPSTFPQVYSITSEGLRQSVIRALSMLNEEEVDLGLLSLSRDFENTLRTYLISAREKGQVQIPVKDPPERWKLANMIDWARQNRIITDKTALNYLRHERNSRAHGEMPSLEERQLFMKNIEFFAGLYIDYIKLFDDRLNAL